MWNSSGLLNQNSIKRNFHTATTTVPTMVLNMGTELMTIDPMKTFKNPNYINTFSVVPKMVQNYTTNCNRNCTGTKSTNCNNKNVVENNTTTIKENTTNNKTSQKQQQQIEKKPHPEIMNNQQNNKEINKNNSKSRRRRRNRRKNKNNKKTAKKMEQPTTTTLPSTTSFVVGSPSSCFNLSNVFSPLLKDIDKNECKSRQRNFSTTSDDSFIVFFDEDTVDEGVCTFSSDDDDDDDEENKDNGEISPVPRKRVRFADELCEIHPMIQWSYAYQQARKGPWEEYARDRERFQQRIYRTGRILDQILGPTHRQEIYQQRFEDKSNDTKPEDDKSKNGTKK